LQIDRLLCVLILAAEGEDLRDQVAGAPRGLLDDFQAPALGARIRKPAHDELGKRDDGY
jgi:hypothetical protein